MSALATPASVSREQMILDHLLQVTIIARKFHRRCPPEVLLEDLVSTGIVGLLDAYSRFDSRRNLRFKTLAEHRIRGAILDYLRRLDPLPRAVRRFQKERDAVISRLSQKHQRRPSEHEIAAEIGITDNHYRQFAVLAEAATISLSTHSPDDVQVRDVPDPATLYSRESAILTRTIETAIRDLPEPERAVIVAIRNGESHCAIADHLHIAEGRVRQIKHRALVYLRARLGVRPPA